MEIEKRNLLLNFIELSGREGLYDPFKRIDETVKE